MPRRFDFRTVDPQEYWGDAIARRIIKEHPDLPVYTCAAGISPSGVVHFGNFRDVITSYAVARALARCGKRVRLIFSWDNFDRLRKVPAGVDPSFASHIGKPLSKVPDPFGGLSSYAERFQRPFAEAMYELGIELVYLDQTYLYESGAYDEAIFRALRSRKEIAAILLSFMTEKAKATEGLDEAAYIESFYPISVYSRFTGTDDTTILSYDGATSITYHCTVSGNTETVDLSSVHIAKLGWKCDWAMRWRHEGVVFEPGGHDHASPGGSYDTSSRIAAEVFGYRPPIFAEYKFVGVQGLGAKMSGSKGNAVSPADLLEIYDPVLLLWLYLRRSPQQSFTLAFDSEVFRQYDEFDREAAAYLSGEAGVLTGVAIEQALGGRPADRLRDPVPFRQLVGFGQIVQWDRAKLDALLSASGLTYNPASIDTRLPRARAWLLKYNAAECIALRSSPNIAYLDGLDEEARAHVRALHEALKERDDHTVEELETLVYAIPKRGDGDPDLKARQRAFFRHVYQLLIGKDTGPRLGTFLWALERKAVLALLTVD